MSEFDDLTDQVTDVDLGKDGFQIDEPEEEVEVEPEVAVEEEEVEEEEEDPEKAALDAYFNQNEDDEYLKVSEEYL
ncbi:MAG TPA: hypothetical protein VL576_03680 [Candidatus Paceibacterota bacterium]|jgi:hypothetical protein|nr:hypothetical protein [Candidatus Paceibacterota bacterium]